MGKLTYEDAKRLGVHICPICEKVYKEKPYLLHNGNPEIVHLEPQWWANSGETYHARIHLEIGHRGKDILLCDMFPFQIEMANMNTECRVCGRDIKRGEKTVIYKGYHVCETCIRNETTDTDTILYELGVSSLSWDTYDFLESELEFVMEEFQNQEKELEDTLKEIQEGLSKALGALEKLCKGGDK